MTVEETTKKGQIPAKTWMQKLHINCWPGEVTKEELNELGLTESTIDYDDFITIFPYFTVFITVLDIAFFIGYAIAAYPVEKVSWNEPSDYVFNSTLAFRADSKIELWRFYTYSWLHAGILHIGINMFLQLLLGVALETVSGNLRVATVYILGVIGGSLFTSCVTPTTNIVGASAGIYALGAMQIANLIENWQEMAYRWAYVASLAAFIITDLATFFFDHQKATSYAAHIAGAYVGLNVGVLLTRNLRFRKFEEIFMIVGAIAAILFFSGTILYNIINPHVH